MSAEPSASIWEVTRLILESPERSPSEIAQEHGYSAAEVAELMPIFLDTARTDWSRLADDANGWATPAGLDAGSQDAELYLRDLAGSRSIEVAGFDTPSDASDLDLEDVAAPDTAAMGDPLPPDLGELLDDLAGGELVDQDGRDSLDGSDLDDPADVDGWDGPDPVRLARTPPALRQWRQARPPPILRISSLPRPRPISRPRWRRPTTGSSSVTMIPLTGLLGRPRGGRPHRDRDPGATRGRRGRRRRRPVHRLSCPLAASPRPLPRRGVTRRPPPPGRPRRSACPASRRPRAVTGHDSCNVRRPGAVSVARAARLSLRRTPNPPMRIPPHPVNAGDRELWRFPDVPPPPAP